MRLPNALAVTAALGVLTLGAGVAGSWMGAGRHAPASDPRAGARVAAAAPSTTGPGASPTTSAPVASTTTAPPTTAPSAPASTSPVAAVGPGDHGPITSPPLPAPGPGFVPGAVTAVGDSVMIDYQGALAQDIPGVRITAAVSRQWTQGESILASLKAEDALGAVVIVGLGTNGPISTAAFDSMLHVLTGASRVVFVNVHVDRTWQDGNDAVLAQGVADAPRTVLADWNSLADQNPGWFYATGTHLPIDGPGAQALAALVAAAA